MTRLRGPLPVVLLSLFGTVSGLAVLEAGARFAAVREERRQGRLDRDLTRLPGPRRGAVAALGQIIERSPNPRIVYELRPRLDVVFSGARLTTSDEGYRGPDVSRPKPASVYRIVGIGDSYMFGQGVSDNETYLARVPALLQASLSGRSIETVNLAVPGFNTVMEVEMMRERAAALDPDLILIEIVGNDLDLPNFLWSSVDPWTPKRLYLLDFIRGRLGNAIAPTAGRGLLEAPREGGAGDAFSREDHVPDRYASIVGLDPFKQALRDLAQLGRTRRIPVVAITHGVWFEEAMLRCLEESEIPVLVLRSALRQRARALGAVDYARSPLALSPQDLHPSPFGHQAVAEELAAWLGPRLAPDRD